eukprot:8188096-Alexandrium_andersonii.AAC.1
MECTWCIKRRIRINSELRQGSTGTIGPQLAVPAEVTENEDGQRGQREACLVRSDMHVSSVAERMGLEGRRRG